MTLIHLEGFDGINNTTGTGSNASTEAYMEARYSVPDWNDSASHPLVMPGMNTGSEAFVFGLNGFADDNQFDLGLPDTPQTVVVGFNYFPMQYTGKVESIFLSFHDFAGAGTTHVSVLMFENKHFVIRGANNIVKFGVTNALQPMVWNYIEVKITISSSSGVVHIKVNGITVANETGLATKTGAGLEIMDSIRFIGQEANSIAEGEHFKFDDIYVLDTSGSTNNDFLGPIVVETLFPDGAGDDTDWTPSTGSNFQNVDEVTFDSDTTYNSSSTPADLDLFTADDLSIIAGTVYGVSVDNLTRVTEAGPLGFLTKVKSSTTEDTGDTDVVGAIDGYYTSSHLFEEDPDATAAWTPTTVNAMQIGYEVA